MSKKEIKITSKDQTLESTLLAVMSDFNNYNKYYNAIDHNRLLSNTVLLLRDYKRYYSDFRCEDGDKIDFGKFYTKFSQEWHRKDIDDSDIAIYRDVVIPLISSKREDETDIEECIQGLRQRAFEQQIKETTDVIRLRSIIDEYEKSSNTTALEDDLAGTVDSMNFAVLDKSKGIPYFLPTVQAALGGMTNGQLIIVSADSGTGKSAFVSSQNTHAFKMCARRKEIRPIIVCISEGTIEEYQDRIFANLYRKVYPQGFEEICENQEQVVAMWKEQYSEYWKKLKIFHISEFPTFDKYKALVLKYNPCFSIIDIIDEMAADDSPGELKRLYGKLRTLSGQVCPIMGTTQSGNTEWTDKDGKEQKKRILTDKSMYGSKSGKQGAADTIITIGMDAGSSMTRYVNIPKKKRGKATIVTCTLEEEYSRFSESAW